MPSYIFNSFLDDVVRGNIDFDAPDTFKVMLVTNTYTGADQENQKDTYTKRSAITGVAGAEASGQGYSAGGTATTVTITKDTSYNRLDLTFASVNWPNATIAATGAVIYKSTGVAANDPLIAYVDFGSLVQSTGATFTVSFSSPLRFQN